MSALSAVQDIKNSLDIRIIMPEISKDLSQYHMPHTACMIYYAEHPEVESEKREKGLLKTIVRLERVYEEWKPLIRTLFYSSIENLFSCAREDISSRDYWQAISDVRHLEVYYLKNYLPPKKRLMRILEPHFLMARKLVKNMGGTLIKQEFLIKPELPGDEWKLGK